MAYLDTHTRTSKPTSNDGLQPMGRMPLMSGVYVGFVKDTADVQRNGRLRVWIPEMGSAPDNEEGWCIVSYCSPFAGATNIDTTSSADIKTFEGTQTSYGMWMIPPDINNQVLIMFINGDPSRGIWIGCLYNQFMNNMVPAVAASTNNYQYHGKNIPVAEYNKNDTKVTKPDQATKPYESTKFKGIGNQGLITDPERGVTTSSARREAPSNVFGILTPGPAIDATASPDKIRRKGGSSFIMDDATGSEYVKLTTKSGAQININETTGFIYLINRDGTAWVQMDAAGNVDIFGARNISMRAQRDVNIRADRNINIEAGQNIFMKAAKDTKEETVSFTSDVNNTPTTADIPVWNYKGEGKGDGGNIIMQALNNWHSTTKNSAFLTVTDNNLSVSIGNALTVTTIAGGQDFNSKLGIKMTTDAAMDLAATGNIRAGAKGSVSIVGKTNVILCSDANISINAAGNIIEAAAGSMSLEASSLEIGMATKMPSLDVGSIKASATDTGSINSKTVVYDSTPIGSGKPASPSSPGPLNTITAEGALAASSAKPAEIKPMNEKINILATWGTAKKYDNWVANKAYTTSTIVTNNKQLFIAKKDVKASATFKSTDWASYVQQDKFKRNSLAVQTTVTTFPTYEPCPEHEAFKIVNIAGYTPIITPDNKTYVGSGGVGNEHTASPAAAVNPGANNVTVKSDPVADSVVSKDININALRCQLSIHEGIKNSSYLDSRNLATGGIGHLIRKNELASFPVGTPLTAEQVETWYIQDSASAIKIAQELFGDAWGNFSDIRKRAVVDLSYNLGKGGLGKFVNFIAAMKALNYDKASQELHSSAWFGQVGRRGPNIIAMIGQNVDPNGCDKKFPG